MYRQPFIRSAFVCLAFLAIAPAQEKLGLGKMWTFENPPLAYLEREYGFKPTKEWFDALRLASIRFGGGCSSSFVSPKGLIMTNHHCIRDYIAAAQGENDWLEDGFYAGSYQDEVKLPDLTVQQLVAMTDVTAKMNDGIVESDDDAAISAKRVANQQRILEQAKAGDPSRTYEVVTLYQGAVYQLYSYRVFDDVRVVCAPHLQSAYFGGDPDNFTYPRYCLDYSFARAYLDGQPADTSGHYFKWCTSGVRKGELTFVTGNPGTTMRLLTHAQMEYMRDTFHPIVQELIEGRLKTRRKLAAESPEAARELQNEIFSWANTEKAYAGYWAGLKDEELMAQKAEAETEFLRRVLANPRLRERYGDAFGQLAKVAQQRSQFEAERRFQTHGNHYALRKAVQLVDAAVAGEKLDDLKVSKMTPLERADFVDHLTRAQNWLDEDDPFRRGVLGDRTPEQVATLLDRSMLHEISFAEKLHAGGMAAIEASTDPAIMMARVVAPLARKNRELDAELTAMEVAQGAKIGQALHAVYGANVSPDATFTLRFSDGVADGYPFNGTIAPHRTTYFGLYARNQAFDGRFPFNLPSKWLERKDRIDMKTALNLVSTNDIIGGNSGSPLVNANLEVIGLVFDGNIEMLPNRYVYRGEVARTVSVHADAIIESLRKVYDALPLVDELVGTKR